MRSFMLNELTTPEIESYFSDGGKTALLPVGCTEMHGPHLPTGTDTFIAKALCVLVAKAGNGLVLPEINYTWAGSTDGFAGTFSVEPESVQKLAENIARRASRMGFKRILFVSRHAGNYCPLYLASRRLYETDAIPVMSIDVDVYRTLGPESETIFAGEKEAAMESSLLLASLAILGRKGLYEEDAMRYDVEVPSYPKAWKSLNSISTIGYFMQDPLQHASPSSHISEQDGRRYLELLSDVIVNNLDNVDAYLSDIAGQKNQGWWRKSQ